MNVINLFVHDVPPLLQHIVENLLERSQIIVVTNCCQFSNQDRVLILFRSLVSNLYLEGGYLFLLDVTHVNR